MKRRLRTTFLVISISVLMCFTITTSGFSSSSLFGSSTIDWDSFSYNLGPGITGFTWLDGGDKTDAFATVNGITTHDFDVASGWSGVSSSASNGVASSNAWTTEDVITQNYSATWNSGTHSEDATAGRFGVFRVTGSGSITFSVPYSLQYSMNIESNNWGRTSNFAVLRAKDYKTSGENWDYDWIGYETWGSYTTSGLVSSSGILSFSLAFNSGDTGAVGAGVGDSNLLQSWWPPDPPANPVPEPTTILFLGLGLVGLAGVGRKFKK